MSPNFVMPGQIQRSAEKEDIYDPTSFSNIFMSATLLILQDKIITSFFLN